MGIDFGKMLGDAVKGVSEFVSKASNDITKALDQNGDGKLDFSDLQVIADNIRAGQAEAQRKADLERLKPLFPDDFESAEFVMPKLIRVADIDKPHADNPVCKGSIGFKTVQEDMFVITLFRDQINDFGLTFYPELENNIYYVDPGDRDHYISLDKYFTYMKEQRVAELQRIAQSLGAKRFKVTYKERSKSISKISVDAALAAKVGREGIDAKVAHSVNDSSLTTISIEAENHFTGNAPVKPELHYLKNEINIVNLIAMRMDPLSPLQHQRFNIELSNSSGIRIKDAVKIDSILKTMKIAGNTTVESEAQNEARRILEYEIEF